MKAHLYSDGGVIWDSAIRSRSKIGGTYAWVIVNGDKIIHEESGVLIPYVHVMDNTITNNQTEFYSMVWGLSWAFEEKIKITHVYSDSQVALGRVFQGWRLKNIPSGWIDQFEELDLIDIKGVFVRGHTGNKWNEYVDQLALRAGREYKRPRRSSSVSHTSPNPF